MELPSSPKYVTWLIKSWWIRHSWESVNYIGINKALGAPPGSDRCDLNEMYLNRTFLPVPNTQQKCNET